MRIPIHWRERVKQTPVIGNLARRIQRILKGEKLRKIDKQRKIYSSSVVGGTIVLSPDNIPGEFAIQARSDIAKRIVIEGSYERDVTNVLRAQNCDKGVFVNVGANVGLISIFAAKELGFRKVFAIEPNPEAFELLESNIKLNNVEHIVRPIQKCVAEKPGFVQFSMIRGKPEYSSINRVVHPSVRDQQQETAEIYACPLRDIVEDTHVDMLFIDVEGAEHLVMKGASEVLAASRPVIFFECSDALLRKFGTQSAALLKYLSGIGYTPVNGIAPSLRVSSSFDGNILAIPCKKG